MKFLIEVEAKSLEDLSEQLAGLAPGRGSPRPADETKPKPSRTKAKPATAPEPVDEDDDGDTDVGVDYEAEVKPVLIKLAKTHGREALAEALEPFGVAKGQDLKPKDWEAAAAAAAKLHKRLDREAARAAADED